MLERFGFVMVDVALKLFFFVFTYQSSSLLSRVDFDLLSYFRSTLTMCMGALTSTLGLYLLVYGRKMHGSSKYGTFYLALPALLFAGLFGLVALILTTGAVVFKLNLVFERMGWVNFFMAIAMASMAQLALIHQKATGKMTSLLAFLSILGLTICIFPGAWLIASRGLTGGAYYICLGYGALLALLLAGALSDNHRRKIVSRGMPWRRAKLVALSVGRKFMFPNFVETLFSILAPWLAVYALVLNAGMDGVGPVLFYQALVGLPVFLVYSLTINDHALYDASPRGGGMVLRRFKVMFIALYGAVTLLGGGLSFELKHLLHLDGLSNLSAMAIFAATMLQAELISKGMAFKKAGESSRTMKHNVLYSLSLCAGAWSLTKLIGNEGYAFALLMAWLVTYVYVNWDFQRVFHLKGQAMWGEVTLLAACFFVLIHRADMPVLVLVVVILGLGLLVVRNVRSMLAGRRA